jgi:ribokinase
VGIVVVTRGAAGVSVSRSDGRRGEIASISVEVVDTTGAGDAFCGNFAARLAAGDDLDTAVRWAVAAGALAVTVAGAVPSLPYRDAVAAMVSGTPS